MERHVKARADRTVGLLPRGLRLWKPEIGSYYRSLRKSERRRSPAFTCMQSVRRDSHAWRVVGIGLTTRRRVLALSGVPNDTERVILSDALEKGSHSVWLYDCLSVRSHLSLRCAVWEIPKLANVIARPETSLHPLFTPSSWKCWVNGGWKRDRQRDRERDRETERQRQRDRERQTDKERQRQKETEGDRQRHTETGERDRQRKTEW